MSRIGIWLVIISVVSSACAFLQTSKRSAEIEIGDGGFLSEEPCSPPCLWGIVPGKTTEAEVIEILQGQGVYTTCQAWNNESESAGRGITCGPQFVIYFKQGSDAVNGVGFRPSLIITAEEVIARYGEPQLVNVGGLGVHVIHYQLIMAYPDMLTWVGFSLQRRLPYVIEPSTLVVDIGYDVDYGEPSLYESDPRWQGWRGYGEYWEYD